jgi:hypothetical protein
MDTNTNPDEVPVAGSVLGQFIAQKCTQAIEDRQWLTSRWIEDIIQLEDLDTKGHVHNITKPKTLTAESRISDILFVAGEKNFSVDPDRTVPAEHKEQAEQSSDTLENNIVELLDDSNYESQGRFIIKQATQLGCGILEAPVKDTQPRKTWNQGKDGEGELVNTLSIELADVTSVKSRTIWDYFPDLSVAKQEDCAFEFYRNWLSKVDLQNLLLGDSGFNTQEILDIINTETYATPPDHITELRDESSADDRSETYVIWKCHMTVPVDMVKDLCQKEPEREGNLFEEDDLDENEFDVEILAWVSESGRLLKFCPNPLETDERPYSVFCYDRDTTCFLASPGVPRLIRKQQQDVNASWDRIHDNADLSVGPQWIYDPNIVEPIPIDGEVTLDMTANKGWRMKRPGVDPSKAFHFFNVPSGVEENMIILQTALAFADVETQLPQIAGGEISAEQSRMATESLELLMNAANATQRRIIKDYDDFVTIPMVGRLIDDAMQNNPIEGVHGRFIPNAHGTSRLLLKQTQMMNAMNLSQIAGSNPHFAAKTDWDSMYDQIIRGLQFDPKVVTFSEEEMAKKAEENPPQPSPEEIEAQANMLEAQNEQKKIDVGVQESQAKTQLAIEELKFKKQKAEADSKIAVMKLELEREKMERDGQGKVGELAFKQKAKEREITMTAAAKENDRANEFLIESQNPKTKQH